LKAYVGRDICRHITTLDLIDGKRGQEASTELVVHHCCTLKEARVQVENVTGVAHDLKDDGEGETFGGRPQLV
jgi:hypothetical protein